MFISSGTISVWNIMAWRFEKYLIRQERFYQVENREEVLFYSKCYLGTAPHSTHFVTDAHIKNWRSWNYLELSRTSITLHKWKLIYDSLLEANKNLVIYHCTFCKVVIFKICQTILYTTIQFFQKSSLICFHLVSRLLLSNFSFSSLFFPCFYFHVSSFLTIFFSLRRNN